MKTLLRIARNNRGFLLFLFLMFAFRSAIADWNDVPSGSMRPTIIEGDRIVINKLAYDLHIPFTQISVVQFGDPAPGDIIIFESKAAGKRLVKRVIGVPGDVVELSHNQLTINKQQLHYERLAMYSDYTLLNETLANSPHLIRTTTDKGANNAMMANMPAVKVPPQHYLVLGDNRDNSADSRVIGFVPRDEIIGRSKTVAFSLDYDNYFLPRSDRFLHTL